MKNGTEHRSVPPFIETQPTAQQLRTAQFARFAFMLLGCGTLLASMLGAVKLLWDILFNEIKPSNDVLITKLAWLALLFFVGWVFSLIGVRFLDDLVHSLVIHGLIWLIVLAIMAVYGRVIYRLYTEIFLDEQYLRYALVFIAAFLGLLGLHLLLEEHDLRPCAIPLGIMVFIHLGVAACHYIFQDGTPSFAIGDAIWLFFMLLMSLLMALPLGLLDPVKQSMSRHFQEIKLKK